MNTNMAGFNYIITKLAAALEGLNNWLERHGMS